MGTENEDITKTEEKESGGPTLYSRRNFLKMLGTVSMAAFLPKEIYNNNLLLDQSEPEDEILLESAKSYIAKTPAEADIVSSYLMTGQGFSASNICGPLSVAIMSDWRLEKDGSMVIGPNPMLSGVSPKDMWLASPGGVSTDPRLFPMVFPSSEYDFFHIAESTRTLDFNNIPNGVDRLKPGDFLYLDGGSFTHFITISRKDKNGCIYATSNIPADAGGFIIDEVMLWDPQKKDGYFRNWANGVGPEKATTGRAGFYLWRRKHTEEDLFDSDAQELRDSLINFFRTKTKGSWNITFEEVGGEKIFGWRDALPYHPASTIKVPIAMVMLQSIGERYREEITLEGLDVVLKNNGIDSRSFDQLTRAMLISSEEDATESCVKFINQQGLIDKKFKELGMENTTYLPRRSSQRELAICWEELFMGEKLDKGSKQYILNCLQEYTANDDTLLGALYKVANLDERPWNKRGTVFSGGLYTMQDTGVIKMGDKIGRAHV